MFNLPKKVYCICALLFLPAVLRSQTIDSRSIAEKRSVIVTPYFKILKTDTIITLDSVLSGVSQNNFQDLKNESVHFEGYTNYYCWFRFIISNKDAFTKELMLLMGPMGMKEAELFQRKDEDWKSLGKTGKMHPFHLRPYQYTHFVYPISISPGNVDTFYLSVDNRHYFKIYAFALLEPTTLKVFENKVYFFFGIIIGLLILFCIFNLYLFISTKEKIHFWYSVYIIVLIFFVLKNDALDEEFIGFDNINTYRIFSVSFFGALAIGILTHVIQIFFANIKPSSWLYKITLIVKWNLILSAFVHFVVFYLETNYRLESVVVLWTLKSISVANVMIIINCIYSVVKGYKAGYFILIGLAVFLVGAFRKALLISEDSYLFPPYIFHLGIICETMILSFGLIYRTNVERRERRRYLKEKEQLQAGFEKKLLESKFEIQEQTLKNVSQGINENIGLALSKTETKLNSLDGLQGEAYEKINNAKELVSKAGKDLENLAKNFMTDPIAGMGLTHAIRYELDLVKKTGNYEIKFLQEGEPVQIGQQQEFILFRVFQEALTNIIKHSHATRIDVELTFVSSLVRLVIKDNGKGFEKHQVPGESYENYGSGIQNMKNRCKSIGADLEIKPNPDGGACVKVLLPIMSK